MDRLRNTINILVPTGAVGIGVSEKEVAAGIAAGAHAIACDAGSTDSGPAYLATGVAKYSRDAVKHDLAIMMRAQAKAKIPLLIGSCGTSGCDAALDWTRDIALEIAREEGLHPKIALLYAEQPAQLMAQRAREGRIKPLAPFNTANPEDFTACDHIVALMGPEPFIAALEQGANIVLGGRASDSAVLAAFPVMKGAGAGPSWHAAKVAECGSLCTTTPRAGGVMVRIGQNAFEIEPLTPGNRCTPRTVSAHLLYENNDPFELVEPGGIVDVTHATYEPVDDAIVRVNGSQFRPTPYTMKLEGAAGSGYQTIMLVGIQDRAVLAEIDRFVHKMQEVLTARVRQTMGERAGNFDISIRPYGWNAVTGAPVPAGSAPPREVGLLFVATAATQQVATQIAKTCNPWFFHLPLNEERELPSYAFPFSPAEIERGQVFDFKLNHVVQVADGHELVRTVFVQA
ncbi:acyclic terpene utilization AtuA family protein [Ramlibacter albus]|uniref:Acyclic terpene utilization AtuA family protein n=1 Tax=Ramlibacter albus TaxID=2079448 RepID=A0A923M5F6_9BURK|nr:acyclic terpene utilization AtuA family protein [Ramlibacter albus]MBC5764547.1 acyclic terpene utilization AtuA family protein [Ramlibacter albus]